MKIGKIGSVSKTGESVVYDADSEEIYSIPIPHYPLGTVIHQDGNGNWRADLSLAEEGKRLRISQAEDFYYATKHFLPYSDYVFVVDQFPTTCYSRFQRNPFFLCELKKEGQEKSLISVALVDKNISLTSFSLRLWELQAVIRAILLQNEKNGHTWLAYEELERKVLYTLKKDGHPLLTGNVGAFLCHFEGDFHWDKEGRVALEATYRREKTIYRILTRIVSKPCPFPLYHPTFEQDFSLEQNHAVEHLITEGGMLSILTGGPGTGKTTILRKLVSSFQEAYPEEKIVLLAPTGKAAKHIRETFDSIEGVEIKTAQKFLGYGHTLLGREIREIRSTALILLDESSMVDLELLERLLTVLDMDYTKLILVGDVDQLPSIKAGNVLYDLISLGVYTERLEQNYRSQGSIVDNARRINKMDCDLQYNDSFRLIEREPEEIDDEISRIDTDCIITPYRKEAYLGSSRVLNEKVQRRLFGLCPVYGGFHVGDRIIMNETNYKQEYYNGETGVIIARNPNGDYVINYGDRNGIVKEAKDMDLGYAITVHKSQGSEYEDIIISIPQFSSFITKRMLYTAVTRAKRRVTIYSTEEILSQVIQNNKEEGRRTFLSSFPKL